MAANRITMAEFRRLAGKPGKLKSKPKKPSARRPVKLMKPTWRVDGDAIEFVIPVRVVTLENERKHWKAKASQAASQRKQAIDALWWAYNSSWCSDAPEGWLIVPAVEGVVTTLTRFGVGRLDPGNLEGCFKHLQDGIAEWLGVNDGGEDAGWVYKQEKSDRYGVRVRIAPGKVAA